MSDMQEFWLIYLSCMLFSWGFVFIAARVKSQIYRSEDIGKTLLWFSLIPVVNIILVLIQILGSIISIFVILFRFISNDKNNH
ncbi:hypothetical protein [Alishewanella phage vB_AspM_Slicko01]|nr:hypothetical protein [Alishewanella phage vB_AspM_Slicko01]